MKMRPTKKKKSDPLKKRAINKRFLLRKDIISQISAKPPL